MAAATRDLPGDFLSFLLQVSPGERLYRSGLQLQLCQLDGLLHGHRCLLLLLLHGRWH
jgi:hypothetical protein